MNEVRGEGEIQQQSWKHYCSFYSVIFIWTATHKTYLTEIIRELIKICLTFFRVKIYFLNMYECNIPINEWWIVHKKQSLSICHVTHLCLYSNIKLIIVNVPYVRKVF